MDACPVCGARVANLDDVAMGLHLDECFQQQEEANKRAARTEALGVKRARARSAREAANAARSSSDSEFEELPLRIKSKQKPKAKPKAGAQGRRTKPGKAGQGGARGSSSARAGKRARTGTAASSGRTSPLSPAGSGGSSLFGADAGPPSANVFAPHFQCVVCQRDLSRSKLNGRLLHLKQCAQTYGMDLAAIKDLVVSCAGTGAAGAGASGSGVNAFQALAQNAVFRERAAASFSRALMRCVAVAQVSAREEKRGKGKSRDGESFEVLLAKHFGAAAAPSDSNKENSRAASDAKEAGGEQLPNAFAALMPKPLGAQAPPPRNRRKGAKGAAITLSGCISLFLEQQTKATRAAAACSDEPSSRELERERTIVELRQQVRRARPAPLCLHALFLPCSTQPPGLPPALAVAPLLRVPVLLPAARSSSWTARPRSCRAVA